MALRRAGHEPTSSYGSTTPRADRTFWLAPTDVADMPAKAWHLTLADAPLRLVPRCTGRSTRPATGCVCRHPGR